MECLQKLARDKFLPQTSGKFDDRGLDQEISFIEAVFQDTVATLTDRRVIKTEEIPT